MKHVRTYTLGALALLLAGCSVVNFKTTELYQNPPAQPEPANVDGFYSVTVFEDFISAEMWFTENKTCIDVTQITDNNASGAGSLKLKWNKDNGLCDWVGIGIGWDGWVGKDVSNIIDKAAFQFKFRAVEGELKNLPLACALEDYSGGQAWAGFSPKTIEGGVIDNEWTTVTIPLDDFDFKLLDCDATNIKQMLIQFEASGEVYLDEIKVVPYSGSTKNTATMAQCTEAKAPTIDGALTESIYNSEPSLTINEHTFHLTYDNEYLYLAANIVDKHPLQNDRTESNIWDGDAIELAITGNAEADPKRKRYLMSDVQLGFRCSEEVYVWSWRASEQLTDVQAQTKRTENGYTLEARIPLKHLGYAQFKPGNTYGLEIAVDNGAGNGRVSQECWNSGSNSNFHQNPSLWGRVLVTNQYVNN